MRLFVAAWPGPAVVEQLAALDRPALPGVRWTTSDQWHVTLQFLGEVADVDAVGAALETMAAGAVTAVAGPTVRRLGQSVLCVPVGGVEALAAEVIKLGLGSLGDAGAGAGEAAETADRLGEAGRQFRGHLTLARGRRGVDLRPLASAPFSAGWLVEDITLVASRLHPEGAKYEVVARYPLVQWRLGSL